MFYTPISIYQVRTPTDAVPVFIMVREEAQDSTQTYEHVGRARIRGG
jgi:hypothetical protein